jgi:hypothetical protein
MTNGKKTVPWLPWLIGGLVGVVICVLVGLLVRRGGPTATRPPTTFPAESILTVSLDRIKKYADGLEYAGGLGADSQLVDFERGQLGAGTPAKIEPEVGSYLLERPELEAGRIIARIRTGAEVRQLGFGPWWTWWWVDKRGPGGTWRSIYIAEVEKSPADRHPRPEALGMDEHEGGGYSQGGRDYSKGGMRYQQALARWEVVSVKTPAGDPFEIASWGSCSPCCKQRLPVVSP